MLFHRVYSRLVSVDVPTNVGTLRLFTRDFREAALDYPEAGAVYGPLMAQMGFSAAWVGVDTRPADRAGIELQPAPSPVARGQLAVVVFGSPVPAGHMVGFVPRGHESRVLRRRGRPVHRRRPQGVVGAHPRRHDPAAVVGRDPGRVGGTRRLHVPRLPRGAEATPLPRGSRDRRRPGDGRPRRRSGHDRHGSR